jgi:hypothetical protein
MDDIVAHYAIEMKCPEPTRNAAVDAAIAQAVVSVGAADRATYSRVRAGNVPARVKRALGRVLHEVPKIAPAVEFAPCDGALLLNGLNKPARLHLHDGDVSERVWILVDDYIRARPPRDLETVVVNALHARNLAYAQIRGVEQLVSAIPRVFAAIMHDASVTVNGAHVIAVEDVGGERITFLTGSEKKMVGVSDVVHIVQ